MQLRRIVIKNFRSLKSIDISVSETISCAIGENSTGKSNLIHALRICLDVTLSSTFRTLVKEDIHCSVNRSQPFQVLIGVEFVDFEGNENQEAMLHGTQIGQNRARIFYRFRPKRKTRELLKTRQEEVELTLDDFAWELVGGGNPQIDLADIEWNVDNEDIGATSIGFQYLQSYLVVYLPALRDVESDLRQERKSPLSRLFDTTVFPETEKDALIEAVAKANQEIEASPAIRTLSESIDASFKEVTGPAFEMKIDLGLSDPSFQAILRNIQVLLSNGALENFEPTKNGLGLNNILYISILTEYLRKRAAKGNTAGELLLIEEPEAHLHPQLQTTLLDALLAYKFQTILTTHSTQITSRAPLSSFIMLTQKSRTEAFISALPHIGLTSEELQDLERYLDATKSNLLFARKVMLVEGAAELLLIPALVKSIMNIDLERHGISIIAIHGLHFKSFVKLFSESCLPKYCAIVCDADLDDTEGNDGSDDNPPAPEARNFDSTYTKTFLGATTFEKELMLKGNLEMFKSVAKSLGAPKLEHTIADTISRGITIDNEIRAKVLRTAKRFGKGRFAQVAARHAGESKELPTYIENAVKWLLSV